MTNGSDNFYLFSEKRDFVLIVIFFNSDNVGVYVLYFEFKLIGSGKGIFVILSGLFLGLKKGRLNIKCNI